MGGSKNATSQTEETKKSYSWIPVGPKIIRTAGEERRKTYSKGGKIEKKEH